MSDTDFEVSLKTITELIWDRDRSGLERAVEALSPADVPLVISRLDTSDRCELFTMLDAAMSAELVVALQELDQHRLLASLSTEHAARIMH
mgnify:CR=1 FL=1